jgi:hypothetical protein
MSPQSLDQEKLSNNVKKAIGSILVYSLLLGEASGNIISVGICWIKDTYFPLPGDQL